MTAEKEASNKQQQQQKQHQQPQPQPPTPKRSTSSASSSKPKDSSTKESSSSTSHSSNNNTHAEQQLKRLQALEAKAVAEATATADAAFVPSPSLLNATSPEALMKQVDGANLKDYQGKESIYVGRSVPVSAGGNLSVPIQVTTPGSIVEYAVENKQYDIGFGITAEREEGITIVKELDRCDASQNAITGKFLVGSVPCLIQFQFQNDYSWLREKIVSYKVTVTPPSLDTLLAGRRRRANACLKAVQEDAGVALKRLSNATEQRTSVEQDIAQLQKELEQKKKSLQVLMTEENWLKDRVQLRKLQTQLLQERLDHGWPDDDTNNNKDNDNENNKNNEDESSNDDNEKDNHEKIKQENGK